MFREDPDDWSKRRNQLARAWIGIVMGPFVLIVGLAMLITS